MEDIQNQLTNTSDGLPHLVSSSHSSSTQATAVVVHCDKSKCNDLIVKRLIRELSIRGLSPLGILISITDDLLKRILSSSCPKDIILLHVCEHSKRKINSCVRIIKENTTSEKNVFVFGNSKTDLKYFNEFHCYAIHNDIDTHRLAEIVSGIAYDVEVALRGPKNNDAQIKAASSRLTIRDKGVCSLDDRRTLQHRKQCRSFEGMRREVSKDNSTQEEDTIGDYCYIRGEECVNDTTKEPRNRMVEAQPHETMIRRLTPSVTNNNNKRKPTYYDSSNCNFIDSVTLQNKDDMSGTFIRDSFCVLEVKCDSQMDRKLSLYMNNSGLEKYHKDILTRIIPELRKKQDIRNLSEWLRFDNYKIKDKILCEMENLLLNTSSQEMSIHDLICMVDNILNCCFQKLMQADDTLFLPLRVLTLCFVILYILNSRTARTSVYIQIQNISTRTHSDLNTLKRNACSMVGGQINLLLSLIEFFSENNFHMGIPDDALSQLSQEIVLKEFIPLDYANKFVYIFLLVNKMLQKSSEKAELLSIVLKCTFDAMSKKQKTRQALHPLLYIVNKGIVLRLTKGPDSHTNWNESKQCLLTSIGIFLTSSRLDLLWRCKLLETIEPLLFVADKDIVKEVIRVFEKCGHKQKQIRNVIFKHVQTLLSAANLRIFSFKKETVVAEKPAWCEFSGKIWNDLDVTLHLLIPTVSCLTSGSMKDYRNLADEKETKKRITCLEIMRLLQYDKDHPNFVKLIGYQYRPLPLFYLTECHKNLHTFLLEKRQYHKWLPREKLGKMAIDAISALQFVHSKGIVHRNVTSYSFSINERETIKLHDFSLSKMLQDEGSDTNSYINAVDIEDVPVLWSAPESILEDKYDFRTDTWMLGILIYGLYTHGGMPYTVPGLTTEQMLEYIIFQELKPTKWPCIPVDVFKAIMSCVHTNPDNREDLNHIQKTIADHLSECKEAKLDRLSSLFDIDKMYPPPTSSQPEKGLPPLFGRLKLNLDPRKSYHSIRTSRIRPTECCITQADLTAPDTPIWNGHEHSRYLMVEEPVTQRFVEDELPQLSRHLCMNVLKMTALPNKLKRQEQNISDFEYVLHYKCQKGQNVIDIALGKYVGTPGIDTRDIFYLGLTYNLVKFVQRMHSHQWLLRDLCGYSIFVDPTTLTVFMPRIGRFRRMNQSVKLDDCLLDHSFSDRIRWLPIEVIQHGLYSKESDIYMLGMTIWEIYTALDLYKYKHNRTGCPLEGKPFATIPKDEVLTELYSGRIPDIPLSCPSWLYEMLQSCWNRNRTLRPSVEHLLTEIKNRIVQNPRKDQITHMINFKTIPSVVSTTSMPSKSRSAIVDDENPYLSTLHIQSRQTSVEHPYESNASGSCIDIPISSSQSLNKYDGNDKWEDCYTKDVNRPILRLISGRSIKGYEPSGYYDNAPDSECLNFPHSYSPQPLSTDNIKNDENLDILSHLIDKKSQQVQHSLQTNNVSGNNTSNFEGELSRIDSGIEVDVFNQQRLIGGAKFTLIPAIPERRPAGIPPIPLSKPKILHQNTHPEMQTKALEAGYETDINKCMNHSSYRLSSDSISIGIPDTTNKSVNNTIHTSLEKSKSSMVPTFPSSDAVLSSKMQLPSKDDIHVVDRKIESRLVRSCDFLLTDRNAGLMQKRESFI